MDSADSLNLVFELPFSVRVRSACSSKCIAQQHNMCINNLYITDL